MQTGHGEPLNTRERRAIGCLFAWVAVEQHTEEAKVRIITAARFGVDDAEALPRKDYDEVIRFLLDLRIGDTPAN